MTQTLIQAGPGDVMLSGVQPSVDPLSARLWHVGENVVFKKLGVEKAPGWTEIVSLGENGYEINTAFVDGKERAYIGSARRVYRYEAQTGLISLVQFASQGIVRVETWGNWALLTNGVNVPLLYKNSGSPGPIADLTFTRCKIFLRDNVHVLALNTSNGTDRIEWCAASDVETWTPDRSNTAGNYTIRDLGGEITAGMHIGKQIAVYSEQKLVTGRWTGQPFTFGFDTPLLGIGAPGARSVVEVGAFNIGLSQNGVFETDGTDFRYVDEPDVQQWLRDNVDFTQGERIVGYHNDFLEQVVWHFPKVGGGWSGIPYNYRSGVFGAELTIGATGAYKHDVFDYPLGVVDGKLVYLNGLNAGADALPSFIRTKPLDAGNGSVRKWFDYLRVTGSWTGGRVRLGALEDPNDMGSIEWFYDEAMALEHFFERDTPYIVLEFSASEIGERFNVSQFLFAGEAAGYIV